MAGVGPGAATEYRPYGSAGLMGGVRFSDPPSGGSLMSGVGGSMSYGYQTYSTMNQNTNEPVHSKYAVAYVRSQAETHMGMGAGRIMYGRTAKAGFAAPQAGLGGSIELNDPMCVSTLNKFMKEPAQRRVYGSQLTAPKDFKYFGIQTTQTNAGGLGAWSNLAVTLCSAGVYNGFSNVGLAHQQGYPGDSLYGVWQRFEYKEQDRSAAYDSDEDEAPAPKKPAGETKETEGQKAARLDAQLAEFKARLSEKRAGKLPDESMKRAYYELLNERAELTRSKQAAKFAQDRDATRVEDKTQAVGKEFFWQITPYVSTDSGVPPKAVYISDKCIGEAHKWLSYLQIDDTSGLSPAGMQRDARAAILPEDHGDTFVQKLAGLPQCRVVVCAQK